MGLFDGIGGLLGLGGETTTTTGSGGSTTTQSSSVNLPPNLQGIIDTLLPRADLLSKNALPTFQGPRIADFTPDQLAAFQMTRDRAGVAPGMTQSGFDATTGAMRDFTQADLDQYQNPYNRQVTQEALNELYRRNDQQRLMDHDAASRVGAFGGSRQAVADSMRERNTSQLAGQITAQGAQKGWDEAINQFNTQRGRELSAGAQMGELGKTYASTTAADINSLLATGGQQQAFGQNNLNIAYNDFLEQRNAPYQQVSWLTDILAGAPSGRTTVGNASTNTTSTGTNTTPGANPLTALLGLGLGIAGLF